MAEIIKDINLDNVTINHEVDAEATSKTIADALKSIKFNDADDFGLFYNYLDAVKKLKQEQSTDNIQAYQKALDAIAPYVLTSDDYAAIISSLTKLGKFLAASTQKELYDASTGVYPELKKELQAQLDQLKTNLVAPINNAITSKGNLFPSGSIDSTYLEPSFKKKMEQVLGGATIGVTKYTEAITSDTDAAALATAAKNAAKTGQVMIVLEA